MATGQLAKMSLFLHPQSGLSQAVTQVTEHHGAGYKAGNEQ